MRRAAFTSITVTGTKHYSFKGFFNNWHRSHTFLSHAQQQFDLYGSNRLIKYHQCFTTITSKQQHQKQRRLRNSKMASSSATTRRENRLAASKSPYLREHRHNPVDWYQWGEEAFQAARTSQKPIFLSVGYSACHWCHVMRRESFDDQNIAAIMNENFINIKVDREERPDVDRVYMTYCQATTGSGGWPLSVFLTPELKPFYAGTYYPPDDRYYGHPGFKSVLNSIISTWRKQPDAIRNMSDRLIATLQEHMDPAKSKEEQNSQSSQSPSTGVEQSLTLHSKDTIYRAVVHFESSFDGEHGGFVGSSKSGPKFPTPPNLNFLFRVYGMRTRNSPKAFSARDMTLATLLHMFKGGIHDRLAGGFHRYSVDRYWHVPHFEKMLYDQGQLAVCYAEASQIINEMRMRNEAVDMSEPWWHDSLCGIMDYVIRDMSHAEGGFYSAEDAEAVPPVDGAAAVDAPKEEKREGAFYTWTDKQLRDVLGQHKLHVDNNNTTQHKNGDLTLADVIAHHFTCKERGNVNPYSDPHDELKGQNVFLQRARLVDTAEFFGMPLESMRSAVEHACRLLYEARAERPRPMRDDKMIVAWNALMISGCAKAYQATGKSKYLERGLRAVRFLEMHAYKETGTLLRCVYPDARDPSKIDQNTDTPAIEGSCDDYAFLIRALLDMYESAADPSLLEWALVLQRKQDGLFWDSSDGGGGYFSARRGQRDIILDIKDDQDTAEPSSNSVAAQNLIRLHCYFNQIDLLERVDRLFAVFRARILRSGHALTEMLVALMMRTNPEKLQIIICTQDVNDEATSALLRCVFKFYLPFKTLIVLDEANRKVLEAVRPELKDMKMTKTQAETNKLQPTAYVCANFTCQEPCTDADVLEVMLKNRLGRLSVAEGSDEVVANE